MMQVIEQTRDEKIAMYLKLTKRELAEMLINANANASQRQPGTALEIGLSAERTREATWANLLDVDLRSNRFEHGRLKP